MTDDTVRQLAQSDPVPTLTARWGRATAAARKTLDHLDADLRELDTVRELLRTHKLTVTEDLGPMGNAAAHARTAQLADSSTHGYRLPTERVA